MGCRHCLQCSTAREQHMDRSTWLKAISIAKLSKATCLMVSGGEPTDHPYWEEWVDEACTRFNIVTLATNGLWLLDEHKVEGVRIMLKFLRNLFIQVTSVPGIYSRHEEVVSAFNKAHLPRTVLHDGKLHIKALGRAAKNEPFVTEAKTSKGTTSCFSSAVMSAQLPYLSAVRELESMGKICHPLIDWRGDMHWSESWKCPAFANVFDTFLDIQRKAHAWRPCGRCQDWKKAIASREDSYIKALALLEK